MLNKNVDVHDAMIALHEAETSVAADGADPQQAGTGVSGHHADAHLEHWRFGDLLIFDL
jgi:hypothetical protein